jgi:hypothetical protein
MSAPNPPSWTPLTSSTVYRFTTSTIEARRTTEPPDIETHETKGIARDGLGLWLTVDGDGLLVDGPWEVRQTASRYHRDARAFVA